MYCTICGIELTSNAKFCANCGSSVISPARHGNTRLPSSEIGDRSSKLSQDQRLRCPQCNKDDQIQKVSAIVASHTQEISGGSWHKQVYIDEKGKKRYEDDYAPYSAVQSSKLAQSLSSPEKPATGCANVWGIVLGGGLAMVGCPCFVLSTATLINIFSVARDTELLLSNLSTIFFTGTQLLFACILMILAIVVYYKLNQRHRKRLAHYEEVDLPKWERAVQRWNELYYCFRDDCVFVSADEKFATLTEIKDFLYTEN